ncbi:MAG TPA: hypothetical protein VFZ53_20035 [Polyangiaceae bacterium]
MACGSGAAKESAAPKQAGDAQAEHAAEPSSFAAAPTPGDEAPSSTAQKDDERAQTLSQAIGEFDRARLELSELLGRDFGDAQESAAPPAAGAPAPGAPKNRSADKASSRAEGEASRARPLKKGDDGCVNVCRAFDSLARSAAAVCRLDDGERCRKANGVVSVAQDDAGVKACACKK